MLWSRKYGARRTEVRKNRPDLGGGLLAELKARGMVGSLGIAAIFAAVAAAIIFLREDAVPYKPGQYVPQDIVSRVDFSYQDHDRLIEARKQARDAEPRVYQITRVDQVPIDSWETLRAALIELPDRLGDRETTQLPPDLMTALQVTPENDGVLNVFRQYQLPNRRKEFQSSVDDYIKQLAGLVVLPREQRQKELERPQRVTFIVLEKRGETRVDETFAAGANEVLFKRLSDAATRVFNPTIASRIASYSINTLRPTHTLDEKATIVAQNIAADRVPVSVAEVEYKRNQVLVTGNHMLDEHQWQLLRAEKEQFVKQLGRQALKTKLGLLGLVVLISGAMAFYVNKYHPRIVRNHVRGVAICALMLSMLFLAQVAAIGSGQLFIFGLAPTIVVAMIVTIAYDQRFAVGIASMHGLLVALALDQGVGFYIILWTGVFTCCYLLDDIRTRSKLIEVGGATALAMIAASAAAGAVTMDPIPYIAKYCLYAGAAGMAAGFVVLGILPFIEKAFKITTSMTLLELADASQPLLKRLAIEAPGTYNHSLQVATLSEAAADAIGANSLLCRVAAYYHDVGKINKADYFIENQVDGKNRHINLSPSVSLLIIIGHVKDGIELAKEYNLPASILPFIQQHHGTTLIEYFYHRACTQQDVEDGPSVPETQYRYPGPKPKSKEIAIVMVADAVESAVRAMSEPNASRIETLVHELAMKRLHDGQFDECDLTFRELEQIERALTKTLLGIYHGRIAYPSTAALSGRSGESGAAIRSA